MLRLRARVDAPTANRLDLATAGRSRLPAMHTLTLPTSPARRAWLGRVAARLLETAAAGAFLGAVGHHVAGGNFRPLAAFCLPVLVAFVGFTSLLFMRGKSLRRGRVQIRTLYAAERSMQATVWYFTGILLGFAMYGTLQVLPGDAANLGPWAIALFVTPAVLMQVGMVLFVRAAWVIAPQLLRRVSHYEVWRRIREDKPLDLATGSGLTVTHTCQGAPR
jgi:hypothetical protein